MNIYTLHTSVKNKCFMYAGLSQVWLYNDFPFYYYFVDNYGRVICPMVNSPIYSSARYRDMLDIRNFVLSRDSTNRRDLDSYLYNLKRNAI